MNKEQKLVEKILSGFFLSREEQNQEYREYFDSEYNYETRETKYVEMPDNLIIFWSRYKYEDYNGDGEVWGFNTISGKFFNVQGGHCSCYGLEGQWEEIDYSYDEMVAVLERIVSAEYIYDEAKVEAQKELLKIIKGENQ